MKAGHKTGHSNVRTFETFRLHGKVEGKFVIKKITSCFCVNECQKAQVNQTTICVTQHKACRSSDAQCMLLCVVITVCAQVPALYA